MIRDFMTKPTQGSLSKNFRDLIRVFVPVKKDIQESEIKKKNRWIFSPWK